MLHKAFLKPFPELCSTILIWFEVFTIKMNSLKIICRKIFNYEKICWIHKFFVQKYTMKNIVRLLLHRKSIENVQVVRSKLQVKVDLQSLPFWLSNFLPQSKSKFSKGDLAKFNRCFQQNLSSIQSWTVDNKFLSQRGCKCKSDLTCIERASSLRPKLVKWVM